MKKQLLRLAGGAALAAVALGVSSTGASADSGGNYQPQERTNVAYNQGYKVSYTEIHHFEYEEQSWGKFSYEQYKKPYQHASYKPEYGKGGGYQDNEKKDHEKKDCPHKY